MRSREVSSSRLGGEWKIAGAIGRSTAAGSGANTTSAGAATGAATGAGSALTKFFRMLVVHVRVTGAERLQHPCGAFCARESNNCGQEKQFPQKSAATISAASTELENVLI